MSGYGGPGKPVGAAMAVLLLVTAAQEVEDSASGGGGGVEPVSPPDG